MRKVEKREKKKKEAEKKQEKTTITDNREKCKQ